MRRRNKKTRSRNKKTPWRFAVFGQGKGWFSAEVPNFAHRTNYGICCIHSRQRCIILWLSVFPCEPNPFFLLSPFHGMSCLPVCGDDFVKNKTGN